MLSTVGVVYMSSLGGVLLDILVLCIKVVDTTRVFFFMGGATLVAPRHCAGAHLSLDLFSFVLHDYGRPATNRKETVRSGSLEYSCFKYLKESKVLV